MPNSAWSLSYLLIFFIAIVVLVVLAVIIKPLVNRRARQKNRHEPLQQPEQTPDWYIFYASQRGRAKKLALQTEQALTQAGMSVERIKLSAIQPTDLSTKTHCLFITSTFGNGQAPEAARGFERKLKKSALHLNALHFAVLALGDQQYDRFCGFGRKLNRWLSDQNAQPIHPIITVNQMETKAINQWVELITELGGQADAFNHEPEQNRE